MQQLETELKLSTSEHDLNLLKNHPFIQQYAVATPESYWLKSIYFDTENLILLKHGYVLRIRDANGQYQQTIKTALSETEGALHRRYEWNSIVSSMTPDLTVIEDEKFQNLCEKNLIETSLKPLFTTAFTRTAWLISPFDHCEIELSLDTGSVYTDMGEDVICEVELELFKGETEMLFEFAKKLEQIATLTPETISKAEKGFNLLRKQGKL